MALDKAAHLLHRQLPESGVKHLADISPSALWGRIKVGIVTVLVAAVPTASSPAPTSHTTSSSGPPVAVRATPTPAASLTLAVTPWPSPSPSAAIPSSTPRPPAGTVNWSTRVYLTVLDRYHQRLAITVVDAHGIQLPARFNLTLALAATPCCPSNSTPPPQPFITTQQYSGCCTPEVMPVNLQRGGAWALTGTVTWGGRVERVSESGPVP